MQHLGLRTRNNTYYLLVLACIFAWLIAAKSAGAQTVQINNLTHPGVAPNFMVGDRVQVLVSGAGPNQAVSVVQTSNGVTGNLYTFGYTNASGNFTINAVETTSTIGSFYQTWYVNGVPIQPPFSFVVTTSPIVKVMNTSDPAISPNFNVGDNVQVSIAGAPNQPVTVVQTSNGVTGKPFSFGTTDANGNLTITAVEQMVNYGRFTQIWSVGGVQATPAVSFMVGQLGGAAVTTTDLGETSDGSVIGISSLSTSNGTVSTYSATELDYTASLYYDAYTVAGLFGNGTQLTTGSALSSGTAGGSLSATATGWETYGLQTDHYVVAFLVSNGYYENPLYYSYAPADDGSGDVVFSPEDGEYWITADFIYLGSTIADQIYVPQQIGNLPLADDSALSAFASEVPSGSSAGIMWTVDAWDQAIKGIIPAIFTAESVYRSQNPSNPNIYPIPMILDLTKDWMASTAWPVERDRKYTLRDSFGTRWQPDNPVTVYEILTKVGGNGALPPENAVGWSRANNEIEPDSTMTDTYGLGLSNGSSSEVVYEWQQYWATGFNAPNLGLPPVLLPGMPPNAVPLMILSVNNELAPACRYYGTQGIMLAWTVVGVNGDNGPNGSCPW